MQYLNGSVPVQATVSKDPKGTQIGSMKFGGGVNWRRVYADEKAQGRIVEIHPDHLRIYLPKRNPA